MIKIYKGNLIRISRNMGEDFSVKVTLYYRVGLFNIKKIDIEEILDEKLTLRDVIEAVKDAIDNYDKIIKL